MFRPARGRSVVRKRNTGQRVAQRQSTVLLFRDVACMSATAPELRLIRAAFRSPLPTPPAVEYTGHRNAAPLPVRQCRGRSRPADVADSAPAATSGRCCRFRSGGHIRTMLPIYSLYLYSIPYSATFCKWLQKSHILLHGAGEKQLCFPLRKIAPTASRFFAYDPFRLFASGPAYRLLCAVRHASPSAIPLR